MSEPWQETTIGQCLEAAFSGEWGTDPNPGNAVVFRATDIDDEGRIVGSGAPRRLPLRKLSAKQLRDGDILLEGSGGGPDKPVGRVAYFESATQPGPATCSNFFKTLRPERNRVDPRFFLHKLSWFYTQAQILALQQQTTGIINLKFEEYLASTICVPTSIQEQAGIALVIDTLDTAIRETEAIIAKLKAVKQGLLHDLLTRGIDANGELRPPQSEAPHLYKESPLGWIPKEWSVTSIGQCADVAVGPAFESQRFSTNADDVRLLRGINVSCGHIRWDEATTARWRKDDPSVSPYRLEEGDIVIGMDGAMVGHNVARVCSQDLPALLVQRVARLRARGALAAWIYMNVRGSRFLAHIDTLKTHTAIPHMAGRDITGFAIARPAEAEMSACSNAWHAADARIEAESKLLAQLQGLKTGLMDDLLTGRVRVTPLLAAQPQGSA